MKPSNSNIALFAIVAVCSLAVGALVGYCLGYNRVWERAVVAPTGISNFEECAAAGNAVMESYPRQCRTSEGKLFVEKLNATSTPPIK